METYTVTEWFDSVMVLMPLEMQTGSEKVCRWNQPQTSTSASPEPVRGPCWLKGEDCGGNAFQRETLLLAFGWHLPNVSVNSQFYKDSLWPCCKASREGFRKGSHTDNELHSPSFHWTQKFYAVERSQWKDSSVQFVSLDLYTIHTSATRTP